MSTHAWLTVQLSAPPAGGAIELLQQLLSAGWRLDHDDEVVFLEKGDDDFRWRSAPRDDIELVWRHAEQRAAGGRPIGVELWWQDAEVGVNALIGHQVIEMSLSINRVCLASGVSDVSWYLERIPPALGTARAVEWRWEESR